MQLAELECLIENTVRQDWTINSRASGEVVAHLNTNLDVTIRWGPDPDPSSITEWSRLGFHNAYVSKYDVELCYRCEPVKTAVFVDVDEGRFFFPNPEQQSDGTFAIRNNEMSLAKAAFNLYVPVGSLTTLNSGFQRANIKII